jgi:hypothetical protein
LVKLPKTAAPEAAWEKAGNARVSIVLKVTHSDRKTASSSHQAFDS